MLRGVLGSFPFGERITKARKRAHLRPPVRLGFGLGQPLEAGSFTAHGDRLIGTVFG